MIFALFESKGKMEIQLSKQGFHPGEFIEGMVVLQLNEKVRAKGVSITFLGKTITTTRSGTTQSTSETILYEFTQSLDGEKEYPATAAPVTYPFRIEIPLGVLPVEAPVPQMGGMLGDALKMGQMFGALPSSTKVHRWVLNAKLDVPWSGDVNKTVQITVT
jgi:hypothetical protein